MDRGWRDRGWRGEMDKGGDEKEGIGRDMGRERGGEKETVSRVDPGF